jgi:iron complex transport system ATP-binding protein
MILLEVKKVSSGYNKVDIVKDISFTANRGELLCIVDPNGCGKSTLLKTIGKIN